MDDLSYVTYKYHSISGASVKFPAGFEKKKDDYEKRYFGQTERN